MKTTFGQLAAAGVLEYSDGYRTKKDELAENGFRILRVADVHDGWIGSDGQDFVDAVYESKIGQKFAREGDILLTTKGTIGRIAVVPDLAGEQLVYSPQLCFFRVRDLGVLDAAYLRYWLASPFATRQIGSLSSSTDMAPYLSLRDIRTLVVDLPGLPAQQAIGEVLGALDDKIAANRTVVASVTALAVSLVERAVVRGSEVTTLGQVASFLNRMRVPLSKAQRESRNGTIPYYGATSQMDTVDEPLFDENLVLVGEDGSVVEEDGTPVVQYIWGPSWVNNHAHVLRGDSVSTELLRWLVKRSSVASLITGAVQPKLSMRNLKSLALYVPTQDQLGELEKVISALSAMERSALNENSALSRTRDELLPLLMNGRISVRDAKRAAEAVL